MKFRTPLSKEAYEHFRKKVQRGEKFLGDKKMKERLRMYDRGFRKKEEENWKVTDK